MAKQIRAARHYQRADDRTRGIAERAAPKVAQALRGALAQLKATMPAKQLADDIRAGKDPRQNIDFNHFRETLRSGMTPLVETRIAAAQAGTNRIKASFTRAGRGLRYRKAAAQPDLAFDSLDPDVLASMREQQDELIAQLEQDARDTIETAIADGVANGLDADEIADSIRDVISLTETQAQAVLNYQNMLYNLDTGALDRQLRNTEYDAAVQDAIDAGEFLSEADVQSMVDDYISNYLDYRADTIARTESSRAANSGLHDAYSQAIDRGVLTDESVTRQWQLADHPCPICESIPDNNPDGVGVNDSFDSDDGPVDDPPVHPNCMCSVEYVTNLDMLPDDASSDQDAAA